MKKEKTVFKGKLITLLTKSVRMPNRHVANLEIVRHPGVALIIPFVSKDKIILLKQLRPVIGSYIYELPAGTLDAAESPLECAKREIVEETGYSAKRFTRLGIIFPCPGYSTEKITIFKAEGLKKKKIKKEADEHIRPFLASKSKARGLFKASKLVDAKTICALAFCGWL